MQNLTTTYKNRIKKLQKILSDDLLEKDTAISLSLLCLLAGKSIFLFGPPGTAKSLVARRVSSAFKSNKFFDYLMNRFSTPEEIFGPLSLENLRKDKLVRNTEGFLPSADFAFLDEIWKSSPAILNALLAIINEKKFRNILASDSELNSQNKTQNELDKVPLKGLIAASNELPAKGQSLEALYDRFIIRLVVPRIESKNNFEKLLNTRNVRDFIEIDESLKFSNDELDSIKKAANNVEISKEAMNVLKRFKERLESYNAAAVKGNAETIDVSERRWVNIMELLRVAAVLNDRSEIEISDLSLLKHCLWDKQEQREAISKLLSESIKDFSPVANVENADFDNLKNEIESALNPNYDGVVNVGGNSFIAQKLQIEKQDGSPGASFEIGINMKHINDNKEHNAYIYDKSTNSFNENDAISYKVNNDICEIYVKKWLRFYQRLDVNALERKNGENMLLEGKYELPKKNANAAILTPKIKEIYMKECHELQEKLSKDLESITQLQENFTQKYENIFLDSKDYEIFFDGLNAAKSNIAQKLIDVKRLESELKDSKANFSNMSSTNTSPKTTTKKDSNIDISKIITQVLQDSKSKDMGEIMQDLIKQYGHIGIDKLMEILLDSKSKAKA
ncbi:AAA domain-containing protein [Helicobacter saguini]|uniref:AAA domain-containing protein n=1 Tax=Helicobacter saguini TaxID=1548018 RepID=A0A347VVS5_9HELI|nr:AAA family ATPase [Helicobacter saguini]MWV62304.1 AAA domain-containing protein [Helicobacter saguini]MWV67023.1 AAA domain-containing protein [Helicobacter saguini]MWV69372.1 AAA domain-containing protein [Helicobacter saguini]MWV71073.1 AAA domain-containing protein [Helicobacter saguini]TLD95026.1 hypothetical protein LS64_003700 [Helicobacter saguini]